MTTERDKILTSQYPENWEQFENLFIKHYPLFTPGWTMISNAYRLAKYAHREQVRAGGEKYFSHPRAVASMPMTMYEIYSPVMIAGLLLHDAPEDSELPFPRVQYRHDERDIMYPYSIWAREAHRFLSRLVGSESSNFAITLTKPHIEGIEIKSETEALGRYLEKLKKANDEIKLGKMFDNLHNMRSLKALSESSQRKQINKSRELYRPIFESIIEDPKYGEFAADLLDQIDESIKTTMSSWNHIKHF